MSSATVGAGSVLSGRYRLVEPLASGGMGTVWRALDLLLERPVAVKEVRLPPGLDDDARKLLRRRTIREAQVAARLRHPAIVTIFDVVEQDDRPWIVMELVPSQSLADIIRTRGPLAPLRVAGIGLRVLDAMVAAAAAGVEHRDIKPANVLVTDEGRVVLTDFGIARHVGDETLTSAGLIIGSPDYLAPERARGRSGGLAADLWSLGATMYDAVEGRRPFERNGPLPTLAAVVMDEPDPPQRAGPLRPVIDGLLIKDPAHRLNAEQTRRMLQRVLRGRPVGGTMQLPRRPLDDRLGGWRPPAVAGQPAAAPPEPTAVIPTSPEPTAIEREADTEPTAIDREPAPEPTADERQPVPEPTADEREPVPEPTADEREPAAAVDPATADDGRTGGPAGAAAAAAAAGAAAAAAPDEAALHEAALHEAAPDRTPAAATPPDQAAPDQAAADQAAADQAAADQAAADQAAADQAAAAEAPAAARTAARAAEASPVAGSETSARDGASAPSRPPARDTTGNGAAAAAAVAGAAAGASARRAADDTRGAPAPEASAAGDPGTATTADDQPRPENSATARPTLVGAGARTDGSKPRDTRALPGEPRDGTRKRRKRAVLVGLVVLVLAGIIGILVPALSDGRPNQAAGPTSTAAPTGGAGAGGGSTGGVGAPAPSGRSTTTTRPSATAARTSTAPTPTTAPSRSAAPPATGARVAAPAGFTRYTDPQDGFSLVVPAGWRPIRRDTRVDFDDPGSSRFLRIDTSDTPLADPYQNWIDYERQFRQGKSNYQNLGIHPVRNYRPEEGWTTADWEFILGGTHVLDRNIRVSDARAHAIYWSTPQSQWDTAQSRQILHLAEQSFVPAPTGG